MRQHWKIIQTIHDKHIFRLLITVSSCATIKDNKHCVLDASEFRDNSLLKVATKLAKAHRPTSPEDLLCPTKWLFFIGYFWSEPVACEYSGDFVSPHFQFSFSQMGFFWPVNFVREIWSTDIFKKMFEKLEHSDSLLECCHLLVFNRVYLMSH